MKSVVVIGGGISGIAFTYFLDKLASIKSKKINIDIIEQNDDFAKNKINNFQYNQEIYDKGWHNKIRPNSILFQLVLELGLYRYLLEAKSTEKLLYDGSLKKFPEKMLFAYPLDKGELLLSDIFDIKEKLSILLKLHKKNKLYDIRKITVEDFFLSKINNKVYEKIVEPLLTSYRGSDISKQNFSLLLPDLAFATIKNEDIENIVREMYDKKVEDSILHGKEYRLKFTLRSIIESLESHLSNRVFREFGSKVTKIEPKGKGYIVYYGDKKRYYDQVIISTKHHDFLPWFEEDKRLNHYYKNLNFVSNIVITLVVKKDSITINNEVGEVIFSKKDSVITSVEYVSNKWIDVRSQNIHILRVYISRQNIVEELMQKEDSEIQDIVLEELKEIHKNICVENAYINKIENNYLFTNTKYIKYITEIDRYLESNYDKIYFIGHSKKAIDLENSIIESREVARHIIEKL